MFDFYRFVNDSRWLGGATEYSILDEASPYWFNGIVPLAFGLNDTRLKGQVKYYLDYVIDHQQSDGWLGFETTHQTRGLWARCLLLLGLVVSTKAILFNPGSHVSPAIRRGRSYRNRQNRGRNASIRRACTQHAAG